MEVFERKLIMKKKLLGVCLSLFVMASLGMAASTHDEILRFGKGDFSDAWYEFAVQDVNYIAYMDTCIDPTPGKCENEALGVAGWSINEGPSDGSDFYFTSALNQKMQDYDFDELWKDMLWDILLIYSSGSKEWYVFQDSFGVDLEADGLLTTPDLGVAFHASLDNTNGFFNNWYDDEDQMFKTSYFDYIWGFNTGNAVDPFIGGDVPEPGTLVLLGTGIVGLGFMVRRKMQAAKKQRQL